MSRSIDDARRAADRFDEQMTAAKGSHRLQTKEQLQAAGFAPQPKADPNAGLPRYEDVAGHQPWQDDKVEAAAEEYLQQQEMEKRQQAYEQKLQQMPTVSPSPQQVGLAHLHPQQDVVGVLLQQNQQLMADNAAMREQIMQLMQMIQNSARDSAHSAQNSARPQKQVLRASQMTDRQREEVEYGGGGLLG